MKLVGTDYFILCCLLVGLHAVGAVHLAQAVSPDLVGQIFPLQLCAANPGALSILQTFYLAVHIFPIGPTNLTWFSNL